MSENANSHNNIETDWPVIGLEEIGLCPVCGSGQREELYKDMTDRIFFCAPGKWSMYKCLGCLSAYLDPRPSEDSIHLAYKSYYTHRHSEAVSFSKLGVIRKYMRVLANGYRNHRYGGNASPASRLGRVFVPLLVGSRRSVDSQLREIPRVWPGARLLDVGFGSGLFMEKTRDIGWQVAGVETDPVSVKNVCERGMEVRQGDIEAFKDQPESFDLIAMSHVIEHVHSPQASLKLAFRLLKPGGLLYLDTPNIESFGHKEFGMHWRGLEVPRHLVIFSLPAIESILEDCGFKKPKRIRRGGIYNSLANKSLAIKQGKDPYQLKRNRFFFALKGFAVDCVTSILPRYREYITLYAVKPSRK